MRRVWELVAGQIPCMHFKIIHIYSMLKTISKHHYTHLKICIKHINILKLYFLFITLSPHTLQAHHTYRV